ncbi:hypothetical protein HU200_019401 [Digitaria exilis]|uniref:SCP domain-containing protein n=1 Tax=Digitaria exilis TaxID=1010633 RepID=A0A835F380_9POAL|nr:hypothetical protein HU200_019401 [Digitaria exilis]
MAGGAPGLSRPAMPCHHPLLPSHHSPPVTFRAAAARHAGQAVDQAPDTPLLPQLRRLAREAGVPTPGRASRSSTMAARPQLLVSPPPATTMAMIALVLLCYFPDSAPASLLDHPLGDLLGKVGTANATAPAPAASAPASSKTAAPAPSDPAAKAEREKQMQQLKELEAQGREYTKANGLVSKTNFTGAYKGMAREFVSGHNAARARYGLAPMTWDHTLARHARRWANAMRKDCEFKHSGSKQFSESIFRQRGHFNATAVDAVYMWSDEERYYDKATGQCIGGHDCGHFRLMVLKRHTKMGCARSECFKGGVFISCNYQ